MDANTLSNTYEVTVGCSQLGPTGRCLVATNGNYIYKGVACPYGFYSPDGKSCSTSISQLGPFY